MSFREREARRPPTRAVIMSFGATRYLDSGCLLPGPSTGKTTLSTLINIPLKDSTTSPTGGWQVLIVSTLPFCWLLFLLFHFHTYFSHHYVYFPTSYPNIIRTVFCFLHWNEWGLVLLYLLHQRSWKPFIPKYQNILLPTSIMTTSYYFVCRFSSIIIVNIFVFQGVLYCLAFFFFFPSWGFCLSRGSSYSEVLSAFGDADSHAILSLVGFSLLRDVCRKVFSLKWAFMVLMRFSLRGTSTSHGSLEGLI